MNIVCSAEDISITNQDGVTTEHISFEIKEGGIAGLIDKDGNASVLLRAIGGIHSLTSGQLLYSDSLLTPSGKLSTKVQYVPDDIVCYPDLTVEDFIISTAASVDKEVIDEQIRLIKLFGIDISEKLLDMTFEHNRLIAYILALSCKPDLLLIDEPQDMLGTKAFFILSKELVKLHNNGTAIVFASRTYKSLDFPCADYLFLQNNDIRYYTRKELPMIPKVITITGGCFKPNNHCKLLSSGTKRTRFLCFRYNRDSLILLIHGTGCKDFIIEELTMEETIYEDYSRWTL